MEQKRKVISVISNPSREQILEASSIGEAQWGDDFDSDAVFSADEMFVELQEEEVVGYSFLFYDDVHDLFDFGDICVSEDFRGAGIAARLVHSVFAYVKSTYEGPWEFGIQVETTNERALAFYKKLGFVRQGEAMVNYYEYGRDAYSLRLKL